MSSPSSPDPGAPPSAPPVSRRARWKLRRAVALAATVLVAGSALAIDVSRPPAAQVSGRLAIGAIHWYQRTLSARLGGQCRFRPTCSQYAVAVYAKYGFVGGSWRTAWRIARCGPWTKAGTVDALQ